MQSYKAYCTFPYSTPCNTSHHPVHCICMRSNRIHDSHDSWEPYANLRDNQRLHVYLLEKNLQRLIPKKFR